MTDDLTEIDGIGTGTLDDLEAAGFETIEDIATASTEDVEAVDGFGSSRAEDVVENAQAEFDGDEDTENAEDIQTFSVEESMSNGEDEHGYPVELDLSEDVAHHVIHIVLEEATRQQQSSSFQMRDTAYGLSKTLMRALLSSDGAVDTVIHLDKNELNTFYRALNQGEQDYASRSGIASMYGSFAQLKEIVNEQRQKALAE